MSTPFKIQLIDSPFSGFQLPKVRDGYMGIEDFELTEMVQDVFHPSLSSDFELIWASQRLKHDFISFGDTLEEWLEFAKWLIKPRINAEHFDPWCSSVELSFDAVLESNGYVKMTVVDGEAVGCEDISILANEDSVLIELCKVFSIMQKGLATKKTFYSDLDQVISDISVLSGKLDG